MNPNIFKAYDIRGVYPEELNEKSAYKIGFAFANFTKAKNILVGEDARVSSPSLRNSLIDGLRSAGANVFSAGNMTTPMFYFSVASSDDYDAGVMVTASHNPGKYNGFKMVHGNAMPIVGDDGMNQIKDFVINGEVKPIEQGLLTNIKIKEGYIDKILSIVPSNSIKPLKLVIDAGNGMAGIVVPDLLKKIPQLEVESLYFDIDMTFPNHEANPLKEETLTELKKKVIETKADLGVAYDGDADRVGFVDENGEMIRADYILTLMLQEWLKKYPHSTVLYDLRCSNIVPETIKKLGGKAKMTPVGHVFIKKGIKEINAIGAGELSSHFYFKDFFGVESSDLAMLYILKILTETGLTISELVSPLKKYYQSGEINFEVTDKNKKITELKEKYSKNADAITELDGIKIEFNNQNDFWWFNIRASNTEPLLRLNVEAGNKDLLKEKVEELSNFLELQN